MKKRFASMLLAFIICISFVVPVGAVSGSGGGSGSSFSLDYSEVKDIYLNSLITRPSWIPAEFTYGIYDYIPFKYEYHKIYDNYETCALFCFRKDKAYKFYSNTVGTISLDNDIFMIYYQHQFNPESTYFYNLSTIYHPIRLTLPQEFFKLSNPPVFDDSQNDYFALGIDAIGFSEWLHEHPVFFDTLKKNFPNFHWDDDLATTKFLMQWWNAYGGRTDSMIENFQELVELGLVDENSVSLPPSPDYMWSLTSQIQKQYNKYNESLQSKPIPSDVQQPSVIDTPSIVAPSSDDSVDTSLLKEIIRLLVLQINQGSQNNTYIINSINDIMMPINNNIVPMINNIVGALGGIAGGIANLDANLGDLVLKFGDDTSIGGGCNYDESFWEHMLIPHFTAFDDFQNDFIEKFPILTQLDTVPDPDRLLTTTSPVLLASASEDSVVAAQVLDENFSFVAPDTFANGAFSGISIPVIDFSKFSLAISAFKGIISVFALSIFSKWLFNFAPSMLNGR